MRRDAVLGQRVHLLGAHLDLERLAGGTHDGGVQRLIEVRLRDRDVVVELARDRRPQRVDHTERGVARGHVRDHDADREQVVHLVESDALAAHLLRDRPEVLRAARQLRTDARALELARKRLHRLVDRSFADLAPRGEVLRDLLVLLGLEVLERQVLELPFDLPDAETMGQRRVDLDGLARDPLLLLRRERRERAHVVEPVAELDDHDAEVVRHREDHLADVLGLMRVARLALKAPQLGYALHQAADLVAELEADVLDGARGVLRHVVQQRRRDRRGFHAQLGDEHRHRGGVRDVRLT